MEGEDNNLDDFEYNSQIFKMCSQFENITENILLVGSSIRWFFVMNKFRFDSQTSKINQKIFEKIRIFIMTKYYERYINSCY